MNTYPKQIFQADLTEWSLSAIFLLSLSLIGLGLWPFWLVTILIMVNRYVKKREEFIVQLFILATYSGFLNVTQFPVKFTDILIVISVFLFFDNWKNKIVRILAIGCAVYVLGIISIALLSREPMSVQIRMMRYYFVIITFIIPFALLKNRNGSLEKTGRFLIIYSLVICLFYTIDCFVLDGYVLIPNLPINGVIGLSKWYDPYWAPLSFLFPRQMPQGLYILLVSSFFAGKYFRFRTLYWIVIILALIACRTMTVTFGILVVYIFSLGNHKQVYRYLRISLLAVIVIYFIDASTGKYLRVASTVEQFTELKKSIDSNDIEKIAEFGSGRLAQIYPKMELLINRGNLCTGFGFIHPQESSAIELLAYNTLYTDQSKESSLETPAEVEVTQVQTILNIGLLGLFFQTVFYIFLILYIRKVCSEWKLFTLVVIGASIAGLGGFVGLTTLYSAWVGLALGLTVLTFNKTSENSTSIDEITKIQ